MSWVAVSESYWVTVEVSVVADLLVSFLTYMLLLDPLFDFSLLDVVVVVVVYVLEDLVAELLESNVLA